MATDKDRARWLRWYHNQAAKGRNTANRATWRAKEGTQYEPPPADAAPRREYVPQGHYTGAVGETWRPGQDDFLQIPSKGF